MGSWIRGVVDAARGFVGSWIRGGVRGFVNGFVDSWVRELVAWFVDELARFRVRGVSLYPQASTSTNLTFKVIFLQALHLRVA